MKITASETAVLVAGVKVAKSTYANSVAFWHVHGCVVSMLDAIREIPGGLEGSGQ